MHKYIILLFFILFNSGIYSQEVIKEKNNIKELNEAQKILAPQATGDKVTIKDGTTVLLEIENEGSAASIKLNDAGTVSLTTNKLYNTGGSLYWNGTALGTTNNAGGWSDDGTVIRLSNSSDLVGIGTINPNSRLEIAGSNKWGYSVGNGWGDFNVGNGTYGIAFGVALNGGGAGDVRIWNNGGTERIIFSNPTNGNLMSLSNNKVGIGTINPNSKLEVTGSIHSTSGGFKFPDGSIQTTAVEKGTYSIGDFAQGGIVFWVDETGKHGLACAKVDQSSNVRWAPYNQYSRAEGNGPFAGEMNTTIIVASHVPTTDTATYAARICANYKTTENGKTYGDWYLPSLDELELMRANRDAINATATANGGTELYYGFVWSSNESSQTQAWAFYLAGTSFEMVDNPKDRNFPIRAIRAF